jgi:hypothetical protein
MSSINMNDKKETLWFKFLKCALKGHVLNDWLPADGLWGVN